MDVILSCMKYLWLIKISILVISSIPIIPFMMNSEVSPYGLNDEIVYVEQRIEAMG